MAKGKSTGIPRSVTRRLVMLRHKKGLTQQEVAEMLGVHFTTVSKWELGTNELTAGMLVDLCNLYNTTTDYALGLTDDDRAPISKADAELLLRFHALPLKVRAAIRGLIMAYEGRAEEEENGPCGTKCSDISSTSSRASF